MVGGEKLEIKFESLQFFGLWAFLFLRHGFLGFSLVGLACMIFGQLVFGSSLDQGAS